jgi:hypothetical protein
MVWVKKTCHYYNTICLAYFPETVMNCDVDYVNKPEKYKCLGNTIDENIFSKHNDQEKKTLVKRNFFTCMEFIQGRLFCISTAALITNIPLTSWGNEMKFTEKIEKELI